MFLCPLDMFLDVVHVLLGDEWPNIRFWVATSRYFETVSSCDKLWDPVLALPHKYSYWQSHAPLTSGAEGGTYKLVEGIFFVSVWEDDTVVFGTEIGLHSLTVLCTVVVDVFTGLVGAYE